MNLLSKKLEFLIFLPALNIEVLGTNCSTNLTQEESNLFKNSKALTVLIGVLVVFK
jgi:hypothetical protein